MTQARHTVASLVASVSDADLETAIRNLYWADQDTSLDAYLEMSARLRGMQAASTDLSCVVLERVWSEDQPPEAVIHVYGKEKGDNTTYAIEYVPWAEWLDLPVMANPELELSDAAMLANILYEMSWAGFDEDEISDQKAEIMERKEEVDKLIEEGRISELPTVDLQKIAED